MLKEELINALVEQGFEKGDIANKSKKDLESLYENSEKPIDEDFDEFMTLDTDDDEDAMNISVAESTIERWSEDWHDYIMGLFHPDELLEGKFPKSTGLRRVFHMVVGPIINSKVEVVQAPDVNNERRATVVYSMTYYDTSYNVEITVSDAADCFYGNSESPYRHHPVATATTIAEGRCLRKALNLRTLIDLENNSIKEEDIVQQNELNDPPISENQKNTIVKICQRLGMNMEAFLTAEVGFDDLKLATGTHARKLLQQLNKYQRGPTNGGDPIPQDLLLN